MDVVWKRSGRDGDRDGDDFLWGGMLMFMEPLMGAGMMSMTMTI